MPDLDPMDTRLRAYAARWRGATPPAAPLDVESLGRPSRARRTWLLVAASAAAVAVVIAGGTRLVGDDTRPEPPPPADTTKPHDAVVPWAPLPATHPQIPAATTPPSPDPAAAAGKPECRASDLHATDRPGAAAGTYYLTVRLTLVGDHPCRLEGWPEVELLDRGAPVDIPLERARDDSVYRGPVLVSDGHPALLRLAWPADWCAPPVHNDTIRLALPGGSLTVPGLGGSNCYGTPRSGHRQPVELRTFEPVKVREATASTAYADVDVTGDLDITAVAGDDVDFVVTLTSPDDLVLDPCPDFRIVVNGRAAPQTESHALNCAAVPHKDDHGRPYLPAGTPVRFDMHATAGDPGSYKLSWVLDTVDQKGAGGTLTVSAPTPSSATDRADSTQQGTAVRAGVRTLRAYLDRWRRDGLTAASHAYAAADQQTDSDVGVPRLRSGSVLDATLSSWESPDRFTLEVSLDLHFDGDPLAWNDGENVRFVTLTRTDGALRLEFATSP